MAKTNLKKEMAALIDKAEAEDKKYAEQMKKFAEETFKLMDQLMKENQRLLEVIDNSIVVPFSPNHVWQDQDGE